MLPPHFAILSQSFCQTSGNSETLVNADAAIHQAADGRTGAEYSSAILHNTPIHPTRICPITNAANYGSLERRRPASMAATLSTAEDVQISPAADGNNETAAQNQTEAVRRRMRQRRQSRYKRLRGSDESTECRMGVEGLESRMRSDRELDETRSEGGSADDEPPGSDVEEKQQHQVAPSAQFRGFKQLTAIEQRNEDGRSDGQPVHC